MSRLHIPDRYELKYLLPEAQVERVRRAIRPFCELDRYSARSPDLQYVIQSLYLDDRARRLYAVSREGRPERFKVRVRRYDAEANPDGPVFLEVKRKAFGLVRKSRAVLPADGWVERLSEPLAGDASPAESAFRREVDRLQLEPTLLLRYEREAWFSTVDTYARVTFDRRMLCQPVDGWDFVGDPDAWLPIDHGSTMKSVPRGVLLELKCTRDVPRWMARLTETLELQKTGFSKYCNGVEHVWGHAAPVWSPTRVSRWSRGDLA